MPMPPTKILSQQIREVLDGRRVIAALFTTFTLEPAFFEEDIVSLLAGDALIQHPRARLYQLEQELRGSIGPVAVYYDRQGLRPDSGKKLDIRYVPVHVPTGSFHPKVILLLTGPREEGSDQRQSLICGALSANLTKSGWWSNLECAHFEQAFQGDLCSFGSDLRSFLKEVRTFSEGKDADHEPLDSIRSWLKESVEIPKQQSSDGLLRPRLIAGRSAVVPQLQELAGPELRDSTLEVISPFLDETRTSAFEEILDDLDLREARVFLPTKPDGSANITENQYQAVRDLERCEWGRLPQDLLKLGKDANAVPRGVHAKVYRFTRKTARYEALMVGSHNLTGAALKNGGNMEASFFIERAEPGPVEPWLSVESKRPKIFAGVVDKADDTSEPFIPLQLAYNWKSECAEAFWGKLGSSPILHVDSANALLFDLEGLPSEQWIALDPQRSAELARILKSTSLLQVRTDDGGRASILIQEYEMSRKPSILSTWNVADVLEYWSRLTPEQKAAFLSDLAGNVPEDVSDSLERSTRLAHVDSFFTTFAGIFHGFEMLRKQVLESLKTGQERQADYLLFGQRHDSLPKLIDQVMASDDQDPIQGYLLLLSAQQLLQELSRSEDEFFEGRRKEIKALLDRARDTKSLRSKLSLGDDADVFADWFESQFLKSVRTTASANG